MSQFTSRNHSRRRELERRSGNPVSVALIDSSRIHSELFASDARERTLLEQIRFVIEREPVQLRDTASFHMLKKILPLLS